MKIKKMPGVANPTNGKMIDLFIDDLHHMNTRLGTNCIILYNNFPKERMNYLIVVDTDTGEKIRIVF